MVYSRDDDLAYQAIDHMLTALRARSMETAMEIGEKVRRRRQDSQLDRWADRDDLVQVSRLEQAERAPRKSQKNREQLFKMAWPEALLGPANGIEVFLTARSSVTTT